MKKFKEAIQKDKRLIGKNVKIIKASTSSLENVEGTIIDETQNTLSLDTKKGIKKIIKTTVVLDINGITIKGNEIRGRTEERIKRIK